MPARILVVDNEPSVLGAVRKCLRKTNLRVDLVESAEEALQLLQSTPYDLVITDLMMRGIDGLELMRRMSQTGYTAKMIMLTGYPTIETALAAKRLGAAEYLTKPFTREELVGAVLRALPGDKGPLPESLGGENQSSETYLIRGRSWVSIEPEGTARLGMTVMFAASLGSIADIELPSKTDRVEQGRACATIHTVDKTEHTLSSPLSGEVLATNPLVLEDPNLASRDAEGAGWLIRIRPDFPNRELQSLSSTID